MFRLNPFNDEWEWDGTASIITPGYLFNPTFGHDNSLMEEIYILNGITIERAFELLEPRTITGRYIPEAKTNDATPQSPVVDTETDTDIPTD